MNVVIQPNEGVGPVKFGMSRAEVRDVVGNDEPCLKRSDGAVSSDYFASMGMLVHYDHDETVEAVEVGTGKDVCFLGEQLLKRPLREIVAWMRAIDPGLQLDDVGFTSLRYGIGGYAPQASKSPDAVVEGIIGFRAGYYG